MVWKTKDQLHMLNIIQDNNLRCVLCNNIVETIDHLFVDYFFSWKVCVSVLGDVV